MIHTPPFPPSLHSVCILPLDHMLVVGWLTNLFTLFFSLACIIKIQPFSNHKMACAGLEPQRYITQLLIFTTRPLARCWKPSATYSPKPLSLACAIIRHISSHKMAFVGLGPQWYITQRVYFTTRPHARCWMPNQLIHLIFSLACIINCRNCRTCAGLESQLVHYAAGSLRMVYYPACNLYHWTTCSLLEAYRNLYTY